MKKVIIHILLSIVCTTALAVKPEVIMPSVPPGGTLNFNVYLSNVQDTKSVNSPVVTTKQTEVRLPHMPLFNTVKQNAKASAESLEQLHVTSKGFLESYGLHLTVLGIISAYATLCYYVVKGNYYLDQQNLWSSWRAELPLDQLLAIPHEQISQDLIAEIQRRYSTAASLTDIIVPLSRFLKDSEEEETQLQWYNELYSWLTFLHCQRATPANIGRYNKIQQRLQRLAYYKNIIKTWASNYKMEQLAASKKGAQERAYADIAPSATLIQKRELRMIHGRTLQALIRHLPEYK